MINTQNNFGASQVQAGSCKYYHVFVILASKITVVSSFFFLLLLLFLILYIYVFLERGARMCVCVFLSSLWWKLSDFQSHSQRECLFS